MIFYLHIPFCDSKCHYCAFNSYVDKFPLRKAYMQALLTQLDFEIERFGLAPNCLETLFIGGGTPSTVMPDLYAPLFDKISPFLKPDAEITSEANPNSASEDWLSGMHDLGVNRISFGVQSFDEQKLKLLGRNHNRQDALQAVQRAAKVGYQNLSIDLIYGTNIDTKSLLQNDLNIAKSLPINHLSAYSLTLEEKTPFFDTPTVQNDDEDIALWFTEAIQKAGFPQYEISNFGSYRCRHNIGYWQLKPYVGLGCGAVGYKERNRFYNESNVEAYIKNPIAHTTEEISHTSAREEKILLGLRSCVGVQKSVLDDDAIQRADMLIENNNLTFDSLTNTYFNKNYLLSDEIALYMLGH